MYLYHDLKSGAPNPFTLLRQYKPESVDMLSGAGPCVLIAQVIHVKKGQKQIQINVRNEKNKRHGKAYDRLIYFR